MSTIKRSRQLSTAIAQSIDLTEILNLLLELFDLGVDMADLLFSFQPTISTSHFEQLLMRSLNGRDC